jgi:hypothetical protein
MLHWAVSFIFRGRSQRTTTRQQIVARTLMARLESTQEALKQTEKEAPAVEPSATATSTAGAPDAANSQPETVGTDSVDELSAAYGDKSAEGPDAAAVKQAPEN